MHRLLAAASLLALHGLTALSQPVSVSVPVPHHARQGTTSLARRSAHPNDLNGDRGSHAGDPSLNGQSRRPSLEPASGSGSASTETEQEQQQSRQDAAQRCLEALLPGFILGQPDQAPPPFETIDQIVSFCEEEHGARPVITPVVREVLDKARDVHVGPFEPVDDPLLTPDERKAREEGYERAATWAERRYGTRRPPKRVGGGETGQKGGGATGEGGEGESGETGGQQQAFSDLGRARQPRLGEPAWVVLGSGIPRALRGARSALGALGGAVLPRLLRPLSGGAAVGFS